jgi:hypothetical protein
MYLFFHYATGLETLSLPDWKNKMNEAKLKLSDRKGFFKDFINASLWE